MMRQIKAFCADDAAAITVDWVVLTAAVIGVLFGSLTVFTDATMDHADRTGETMVEHPAGRSF